MHEYPCQYSIARFHRNPLRDEPRNFGVVLQCSPLRYVSARIDSALERFSAFAADLAILGMYAKQFDGLTRFAGSGITPLMDAEAPFDPSYLSNLSLSSRGNIHFTEPRGCITDDPQKTLNELYELLVASDEPATKPPVVQDESIKSNSFVAEVVHYIHSAVPDNKRIKAGFSLKMDDEDMPFDLGYARPFDSGVVLFEAIDLSKGSYTKRVTNASPSVLKFDMVQKVYSKKARRCAVIREPIGMNGLSKGNGHSQSKEIKSRIQESADEVYDFVNHVDLERLVSSIRTDFIKV